ncbi:MAG: hypothetical protein AABY78_01540 [Nitrospirota bacterium]
MSNYTFITVEKESFFNDFFGEGKFPQKLRSHFDTIESFLKSSSDPKNIVLLWHLSASGIDSSELKEKITAINSKFPSGLVLKIGKSEASEFINIARQCKWFDICGVGSYVKEKCNEGNWNVNTIVSLRDSWRSKEKLSEITTYLLHLFLPLDIDMQALELLEENKKGDYLNQMYNDNTDYYDKFGILQSKIKELSEIEGIDKNRLSGIINDAQVFFQNLIKRENDPKRLLKDSWKDKEINSFHDWYCALAECLRESYRSNE